MWLTIIIILSANCLHNCQEVTEEEIDYYETLITTEIDKANKYQFPQNAENYSSSDEGSTVIDYGTYDYIIIGSGSAGSVVANRLSELPNILILVIEAGGFENNFTDIPEMSLHAASYYNWGFNSTTQSQCCLANINQKCSHPRGKGYGGSSIINGLVYSRGEKSDYDRWGKENKGWDYETVLKYYKKSENSHINGDTGYHSTGGLLNVEYSSYNSPHLNAYLEANKELGRNIIDYNGKTILGVSAAQFNTINGRRLSTGKAFIKPAQNRNNLHLSSYSYATKIEINQLTKTAYAVNFSKDKKNYKARAKREIIQSAGAHMSPHLLMLSGIGPKKHLTDKKIKVINDLQVGTNYKDHPVYFGLNILTNVTIPLKPLKGYINDYLHGTGVYTLSGNNAGVGFFKTNPKSIHAVDLEIMLISPNRTLFNYNTAALLALNENLDDISSTLTMYVTVLHPDSVGTIRLNSNNPYDYPLINTNFFTDEKNNDIETMYKGIQLVLEMLQTESFKKINGRLGKVIFPACKNLEYLSKDFWLCTIKQLTDNLFHPMATCAMGKDPKKGAVVDNKLRVHGIKRLRVVDASVIPYTISGHTNAPSIMIGEQGSDFIKASLSFSQNIFY